MADSLTAGLSGWINRRLGRDRKAQGSKDADPGNQRKPEPAWLVVGRQTLIALIGAMVIGFIIAWIHGPATPAILWSLALASVGFFIGLLFALPRPGSIAPAPVVPTPTTLPPPPPAGGVGAPGGPPPPPPPGGAGAASSIPPRPPEVASPSGRQPDAGNSYIRPPDALLEIADWLTKIIVGLGLVNLKQAPTLMERLARDISGSLDTTAQLAVRRADASDLSTRLAQAIADKVKAGSSPTATDLATEAQKMAGLALQDHVLAVPSYSFGLAMAVFFPVIGLLIGYITTRMYLQTALVHGDNETQRVARGGAMDLPGANPVREYQESKRVAVVLAGQNRLTEGDEPPSPEVVRQLAELNTQYCQVNIPDYRERVLRKNQLTERMYSIVMNNRVNKGWLRDQDSDGYLHALATVSLADPKPDDAEPLLDRARFVTQKHTMYRVVEAIKRLHESGALREQLKPKVAALLALYQEKADPPLLARINDTRRSLGLVPPPPAAGGG